MSPATTSPPAQPQPPSLVTPNCVLGRKGPVSAFMGKIKATQGQLKKAHFYLWLFCNELRDFINSFRSSAFSHPSGELFSAFWNEGYYLRIYLYRGRCHRRLTTCRPQSGRAGGAPVEPCGQPAYFGSSRKVRMRTSLPNHRLKALPHPLPTTSPAINSLFMLFPKYSAKQHSNKEAIFAPLWPDAVGGRLCRC